MAIESDWDIDFTNKLISHIDGDLTHGAGTGTPPAAGDVIRGATSGAIGKILSTTGTAATLTDVIGKFDDLEGLVFCDAIEFDNIVDGGFKVGDTITGDTSGNSGVVRKIDYTGSTSSTSPGTGGTAYSEDFGAGAWTTNEDISVGGVVKAFADGTGEDNDTGWTGTHNTSTFVIPPTTSILVNYDGGTKSFTRFGAVDNSGGSTGKVQTVYGTTSTGTLRLVDVSGTWADDEVIRATDVLNYDTQVGGQSFKLNDTITGSNSSATAKVIAIEVVVAGVSGILTLLNIDGGPFQDPDNLSVGGVTVASVNTTVFTESRAIVNGAQITSQLGEQGGIYDASLNAVRDANAFYTFLQDTFDELGAMDDDIPISAQVKLQQYTLINSWVIPDDSFRFLESGSIQDVGLDNIWTNFATLGSINGIGDLAFFATTPQPQIYIEQNGFVLDPWWLPGQIDVLAKVKSNTESNVDDAAGVEINSGEVTVFVRRFGDTYDNFTTATIAGVAPIPLATANDLDNTSGTHIFTFDAGTTSEPMTVGEEFVATAGVADATKRGVVVAYTSGDDLTGTIEYILTGETQFLNNDVITGEKTGFAKTIDGTPGFDRGASLTVAGLGTDIVVSTVQLRFNYNTGDANTFIDGEGLSIAGATGAILMSDDNDAGATGVCYIGNISSNFSGATGIQNSDLIIGLTSGRTVTINGGPTGAVTLPKDIGDDSSEQPYNAVIYMNRTGADKQALTDMYEWIKYNTRRQELAGELFYDLLGGTDYSTNPGVIGRIYITLDSTYPLVKVSPFGSFAGGTFFGAQGVFIQDMQDADIRNFQLIDANGSVRTPPNLQTLTVAGLVTGDRVAVFRQASPGAGIETNEYSIDGAQTSGSPTVTVEGSISNDSPASGTLRIHDDATGLFDSLAYNSFSGSVFTMASVLGKTYNDGASPIGDVYVPFIQEQATGSTVSVNLIHSVDITLLGRVRKKGILPFEVEGTFIATGATLTAIRTTDTIVD